MLRHLIQLPSASERVFKIIFPQKLVLILGINMRLGLQDIFLRIFDYFILVNLLV